jgi:phosphatidylglycerol lysyltransferase
VREYGYSTCSYPVLNPGFCYWFSPDGKVCIPYVRTAFGVVAAPPIGDFSSLPQAILTFRDTHRFVVFFGVEPAYLSAFLPQQWTSFCVGQQPFWGRGLWNPSSKPSLRAQFKRAKNKGVQVSLCDPSSFIGDIKAIREEWIKLRGGVKYFLGGPYVDVLNPHRKVWRASRGDKSLGFVMASPIPMRKSWLIEQILRTHHAPNGTSELMVHTAMEALNPDHDITLGMTPLYREPDNLIIYKFLRFFGGFFYNFKGVYTYKRKWGPTSWEPLYCLFSKPLTPLHFIAVADAFLRKNRANKELK